MSLFSSLNSRCVRVFAIIMAATIMIGLSGCQDSPKASIQRNNPHRPLAQQYGRIDIPEEYLAQGIRELCIPLSQSFGPINTELIINSYVAQIRQSLYQHGFCILQKMNINGATVDIHVYFLPHQEPPMLRMEAYADGNAEPAAVLASQYHIQQQ